MNPGVGGSNPLVDTIFLNKIKILRALSLVLLQSLKSFATESRCAIRAFAQISDRHSFLIIEFPYRRDVSKTERCFHRLCRIDFRVCLTVSSVCATSKYASNEGDFASLNRRGNRSQNIFRTFEPSDSYSKETFYIRIGGSL